MNIETERLDEHESNSFEGELKYFRRNAGSNNIFIVRDQVMVAVRKRSSK